jgi:ring-1,2-phenylacetyl-CoA epoxidase subunit PaaD
MVTGRTAVGDLGREAGAPGASRPAGPAAAPGDAPYPGICSSAGGHGAEEPSRAPKACGSRRPAAPPAAAHTASRRSSFSPPGLPGTPAAPGPSGTPEDTETGLEAELRRLAGAVPDPELPVLTLGDLGIVRGVRMTGPDRVEVKLTPTYTGCPAVETMSADIERTLRDHGMAEVSVVRVLSPAWSTDDISSEGRRKLAEFGIAPPRAHSAAPGEPVPLSLAVRCPHCGSTETELLSRFSSTACKALRRCVSCREPFDHFKEL